MGGRGGGLGGNSLGNGGRTGGVSVTREYDLVSQRERSAGEVDSVLTALRQVNRNEGYTVADAVVAKLGGRAGRLAMAYYDTGSKQIGVNERYFNNDAITRAYDDAVKSGFHPSRGNKTAMEAVIAHETGHALTDVAAERMGVGFDAAAKRIVEESSLGKSRRSVERAARSVSGYATQNNAELIAEAYADVYANGRKANDVSKKIVSVLRKYSRQR